MSHGTFATALNCIDGRTHESLIEWVKKEFKVEFVDMITHAGLVGVFSKSLPEKTTELEQLAKISAEKHGSKMLVIAGHHDCAGNPVDKETHFAQIRKAVAHVTGWDMFEKVIGLWVNENWEIERVT